MKWIIIFYQIFVALPEGEIIFSGIDLGNKFIRTELVIADTFYSKSECEQTLVKFKGKNKIKNVDTFYKKNTKIVTDREPLSDSKRVVVNAFQCIRIQ